jgi:hypothetical protein
MLPEEIVKAVKYEIREDCVEDALKILALTNELGRDEFMTYHFQDNGNICCMVLDKLKYNLIKEGKMEEGGCFDGWKVFINDEDERKK